MMRFLPFSLLLALGLAATGSLTIPCPAESWVDLLHAARNGANPWGSSPDPERVTAACWRAYPEATSWLLEDGRAKPSDENPSASVLKRFLKQDRDTQFERNLVRKALLSTGTNQRQLKNRLKALEDANRPATDPAWLTLYEEVGRVRRTHRLHQLSRTAPRIVYVRRHPIHPSFFAYTEGQSDAQAESSFRPGSSLHLLTVEAAGPSDRVLLDSPDGVLRDAEVSWDGTRILFAWKKNRKDDYHLYEMTVADGAIRQVTHGEGVADYEGCYLPNGDLLFASSRCVQTVDCFWTEVSNLYTCAPDGKFLRRLSYDQVHTVHPSVLADGRVVYTRWDYNDRGQVYPQALFQMHPDGTGQTEYYGNNSWFPTTLSHARGLPGENRVVTVLMGHHTWQAGKLALIDPTRGRQEAEGVELIAPVRPVKAVRKDQYGQDGELFRHPYPLSDHEFLAGYCPDREARKHQTPFRLCWVDRDGHREILTADSLNSDGSPALLAARSRPPSKPSTVDYTQSRGTVYLQDVYQGPGLAGVERGQIERLRVVALEFRAAGVGHNNSRGEGGGALSSTPISIGNGCWDVKRVLGETPVLADGSAFFEVPARTPVYFQAIDKDGHVAQTMRSWTTLMPGENQSCTGCHEDKNSAPLPTLTTLAAQRGPRPLEPFHGEARGFSFAAEVQPVLDRHCVSCHDGTEGDEETKKAFSLRATPVPDSTAKRAWSEAYLHLTGAHEGRPNARFGQDDREVLNWISAQSRPTMLPPYHRGSGTSGLMEMLREGHGDIQLPKADYERLAAWIDLGVPFCGDYLEANTWSEREMQKYLHYQAKRDRLTGEDDQAVAALLQSGAQAQ